MSSWRPQAPTGTSSRTSGSGATLHARGHRVTLTAPETYRARAHVLGIEFCALVGVAEVDRMLADPDLWHPFRSGMMMARWGAPCVRATIVLKRRLC